MIVFEVEALVNSASLHAGYRSTLSSSFGNPRVPSPIHIGGKGTSEEKHVLITIATEGGTCQSTNTQEMKRRSFDNPNPHPSPNPKV
jgi:hypothetical protein